MIHELTIVCVLIFALAKPTFPGCTLPLAVFLLFLSAQQCLSVVAVLSVCKWPPLERKGSTFIGLPFCFLLLVLAHKFFMYAGRNEPPR